MTAKFSQWRSPERIRASSRPLAFQFIEPAQSAEDLLTHLLTLASE